MNKQLIYTRKWYPDLKVKEEHKNLPVRQVTCFVVTRDEKLLLVSKDGDNWSITAGHYEEKRDPTYIDTAVREVFEESGLDISKFTDNIKWLGYYVVEDVEEKSGEIVDTYLQIRMFLHLDIDSEGIFLKPMEGDSVKQAKFFSFAESMNLVRWLGESGEWKAIKNIHN